MDEIMLEESQHLQSVVNQIDSKVHTLKEKYIGINERAHGAAYDNEDLAAKQYYIGEADLLRRQITETQSYRNSPYFAHMEFDCTPSARSLSAGQKSIYIGKPGFQIDNTLIVDWRAPLGQTYYQKNQKSYDIKGSTYLLLMRRALQISNAKLLHCETEFDSMDTGLENKVGDPFLKRVLKDKRRERRLTDIIATIQENQNQIITQPYQGCFAVQGCAGSGKTMILLHRLSYLLYNHKELRPQNIKIITPNLYFSTFIDDLSEELGLHEIQRLTVEEYYVRLIHAYSNSINATAAVVSEADLPECYLEDVYSAHFLETIEDKYHDYCTQCINQIDLARLSYILEQYGQKMPDLNTHKIEAFRELSQLVSIATEDFGRILRQQNDLTTRIENIRQNIQSLEEALPQQKEAFEESLRSFKETLQSISLNNTEKLKGILDEKVDIDNEIQRQVEALAETEELRVLKVQFQQAKEDALKYYDYKSTRNSTGQLAEFIHKNLQDLFSQIDAVQNELQDVPSFNFTKKNRLAKKKLQLDSEFNTSLHRLISDYLKDLETEINEKSSTVSEDSGWLISLREESKSLEKQILELNVMIAAADSALKVVDDPRNPDLQSALPSEQYKLIEPYTVFVFKAKQAYQKTTQNLSEQRSVLIACEQSLQKLDPPVPEDVNTAQSAKEVLEKSLVFDNFKNVILRTALDDLAQKHDIKKSSKQCRHHLYLMLALCTMAFKNLNLNDSFLNIDEAQDLAVTEYKILYKALGDHCIFNLYGDVNQLVYSYKGITDWDDIAQITQNTLFVLNENYRNTMQITEYCNNVFGAEIYPIGISGEDVKTLPLAQAMEHLKLLYESDPNSRAAILVGSCAKTDPDLLAACWDMGFHWMDSTKPGISILTVEMVKGLEFDHILAIPDQMTDNEMYIAYTRALETLTVAEE